MINNTQIEGGENSGRKSLIERLASLRIQNSPPSQKSGDKIKSVKAPESPQFIPRSLSTKSKFHNYTTTQTQTQAQVQTNLNDLQSSPLIGRRRKFSNFSNNSKTIEPSSSPIGMSSPKYFPKQKVFEIDKPIEFKIAKEENILEEEQRQSVQEVVTSFIDSFTILNNFLTRATNSTAAKLQLQNMNTSFATLQMHLKAAITRNSHLQLEIEELKTKKQQQEEDEVSKIHQPANEPVDSELEEQLKIALSQISEIKLAYDKERVILYRDWPVNSIL